MAQIKLTPGTLPPPACYASEQQRFDAYVAAIIATFLGGIQWEASQNAPVDLSLYWLMLDTNNRPVSFRKWSANDSAWVPVFDIPSIGEVSGGFGNAYTITNTPAFPSGAVLSYGRRFYFIANATNTGAATLNIDGVGATTMTRPAGVALQAGDILSGQIVDVIYTGARWEVQSPLPPIAVDFPLPTYKTLTAGVPAAGSKTDMPHNESKAPEGVRMVLVCNDTDAGFSVGAEVDYSQFFYKLTDETWPAFTGSADVANVTLIRGTQVPAVSVFGATFTLVAIVTTKWSVKVYCTFLA